MLGPITQEQVQMRRTNMAVAQALGAAVTGVTSREDFASVGVSLGVIQDGEYSEDGDWEHYLRCGDPLDSAGCGP